MGHWRDMGHLTEPPEGRFRFVAVDVETASRSASICQIGLAFVPREGPIRTYSTLVDPRGPFHPGNVRVHGITPAMVRGAPTFDAVLPRLRAIMESHPLVQHSRFDQRAFDGACRAAGLPSLDAEWHDSCVIARRAFPELRRSNGGGGVGLASLKRALGLTFRHHDAGEDARAAAQVVLAAEERMGPIPALRWRPEQLELPV